jgi:capsular exopolysaccharide synthesis family protein
VVTPAGVSQLPAEVEVVPLDDALRDFQEAVRVGRPNADANIVTVRVEHTDPLAARDAANTLVARYLARRNAAQGTQARSAVAFLQRQLDTLTRQLAAAERDLQRFSEREGIADLETQANTGVTRLAELQAARNTLDAERRALQALVTRSRAEARATDSPSPYRDLAGFPTLLRNQAVAELLRNLAELDNDRNALLLRRTPEDPDVITRTQRIVDVERQLRSTAETYLAGLTDQVRAIDAQLRASGQELARLPARQVELARLQRTPRALEEIFGVLQTRLKEAQVAQAVEDGSVRLIDPAVAPAKPVKPKSVLVLGLAVVFGAAAGFALALLRAAADRRLRRAAQLAEVTGLPVLVEVPRLAEPRAVGKRSSGREAFRRLRVTLLAARERADGTGTAGTAPGANGAASGARVDGDGAADGGHGSLTLLVTSPVRADGRTLVATHLAATFAAQGLRTLVVDADLRNGDLAAMLGLPHAAPGLVDIAGSASDGPPGDAALDEILYRVDVGDGARLAVLPAGAAAPSAPDLLGGARFQALLTRLRQRHDVIIFDSPSLAEAADADVLATLADGVLVVARLGHTRTDSLAEAVVRLQAVDARLLGAVVNDPERPTRVGGRRIGRARATRR